MKKYLFMQKWYWWLLQIPWLYFLYSNFIQSPNPYITAFLLSPILLSFLIPIAQVLIQHLYNKKNVCIFLCFLRVIFLTGVSILFLFFTTTKFGYFCSIFLLFVSLISFFIERKVLNFL